MGLKTGMGKRTYLTIREGKIAKSLGDKKYELYDSIEGYILGISTREGTYGTDLCIDIKDDEVYQLQIRLKGDSGKQTAYFIAFAHCAPNIDVSKKVEFIPSLKIVDDKKRSALFLKQGGETLKWAYKRGEGMPEPEEVFNKKGELVSVDWSEVEAFRIDKVNELNARASEAKAYNNMVAGPSVVETEEVYQEEEGSDLPF